ncbi:hypothetical protein ABIF65_005565 [Bradyrhizobium japonicum]
MFLCLARGLGVRSTQTNGLPFWTSGDKMAGFGSEPAMRPFLMALGGEDLRQLPLTMRKTNLARLLRVRPDGIFVAPFAGGEVRPDLFKAAGAMGLEGLVWKRRDRRYIAGRTKEWIKVKNRTHAAMSRQF